MSGLATIDQAISSRLVRWSPNGNILGSYTNGSVAAAIEVHGGPVTLDAYNYPYSVDSSNSVTSTGTTISLSRFNTSPFVSAWTNIPHNSSTIEGVPVDVSVHSPSGDSMLIYRIEGFPGKCNLSLIRQAALPVADTYNVVGASYSSPTSVLANDRFKTGAALTVIAEPTKGTLFMNTNGAFIYQKNPGAVGTDKFTYRLKKAGLDGKAAVVTLNLP